MVMLCGSLSLTRSVRTTLNNTPAPTACSKYAYIWWGEVLSDVGTGSSIRTGDLRLALEELRSRDREGMVAERTQEEEYLLGRLFTIVFAAPAGLLTSRWTVETLGSRQSTCLLITTGRVPARPPESTSIIGDHSFVAKGLAAVPWLPGTSRLIVSQQSPPYRPLGPRDLVRTRDRHRRYV